MIRTRMNCNRMIRNGMVRNGRVLPILAALVALVVFAAGCGGGGSNEAAGDPADFAPGSDEVFEREDDISVSSGSLSELDPEVATAVVERRAEIREARDDVLSFRSVPLPGPGRDLDHDAYLTFGQEKTLETDAYRMAFPGSFVEYETSDSTVREFRSYDPALTLISVARLDASANVDDRIEALNDQFLVEAERGRTGPFEWVSFETDEGRAITAIGSIGEVGLLVEARYQADDEASAATARQIIESVRVLQ